MSFCNGEADFYQTLIANEAIEYYGVNKEGVIFKLDREKAYLIMSIGTFWIWSMA